MEMTLIVLALVLLFIVVLVVASIFGEFEFAFVVALVAVICAAAYLLNGHDRRSVVAGEVMSIQRGTEAR
jgi:L-asparagine transporter-like permease